MTREKDVIMQVNIESTHHHLNLGSKEFNSDSEFFDYLMKEGYFKTEERIGCHPIWVHHSGKQCCYQCD